MFVLCPTGGVDIERDGESSIARERVASPNAGPVLGHRQPHPGPLHRGPIEDGRVGEDDATQVVIDLPREPVELRGEVHDLVHGHVEYEPGDSDDDLPSVTSRLDRAIPDNIAFSVRIQIEPVFDAWKRRVPLNSFRPSTREICLPFRRKPAPKLSLMTAA